MTVLFRSDNNRIQARGIDRAVNALIQHQRYVYVRAASQTIEQGLQHQPPFVCQRLRQFLLIKTAAGDILEY